MQVQDLIWQNIIPKHIAAEYKSFVKHPDPTRLNEAIELGSQLFGEVREAACDAAAAVLRRACNAVHDIALLVLPCEVVDPHLDPRDDPWPPPKEPRGVHHEGISSPPPPALSLKIASPPS